MNRSAMRRFSRRPLFAVTFGLLVAWLAAAPVHAQLIGAAGDGEHFWVIRQSGLGRFDVLHRHRYDPPGTLRAARTIRGTLAPSGYTASDGKLWLVYDGLLTLHVIEALAPDPAQAHPLPDASAGGWRFSLSVQPAPPRGLTLRALAASREGLFALVRVEDPKTLEALDAADASQTDMAAEGGDAATAPAPQAVRAMRLLRLDRHRWSTVPLPEPWPDDMPAWCVTRSSGARWPTLVTLAPGEPAQAWVYTRGGDSDAWTREVYDLPAGGAAVSPLAVDRQLVIAQVQTAASESSPLEATLSVLRRGRTVPLGTLSIPDPPSRTQWAVAQAGPTAALVVATADGQPVWSRMNLQGQTVVESLELTLVHPDPLGRMADSLILVAVLVIATLIMLAFWRRDPAWNRLELPASITLSDHLPRGLAAVIDLAPCIALACLLFGISIREFPQHWPGRSGSLQTMAPGLVAIGLFVFHTMLSELFTGRTLGKRIMGLRVTNLRGQPPHLWQVLARNILKALDLIALPLLLLPIIGPNHQRLGDLVARTVVTMPAEEPPERNPD